jgi:hypothetical protein
VSQLSGHEITVRYNRFITGGQVFQIANGKNGNGAYAKAGSNYSIHDNVREYCLPGMLRMHESVQPDVDRP